MFHLEEVSIPSFQTELVCGSVSKRTVPSFLHYQLLFVQIKLLLYVDKGWNTKRKGSC